MRLGFNSENNRYGILDMVDKGLHCGECFDTFRNGKWYNERIELTNDGYWYLVIHPEIRGEGNYTDSLEEITVNI